MRMCARWQCGHAAGSASPRRTDRNQRFNDGEVLRALAAGCHCFDCGQVKRGKPIAILRTAKSKGRSVDQRVSLSRHSQDVTVAMQRLRAYACTLLVPSRRPGQQLVEKRRRYCSYLRVSASLMRRKKDVCRLPVASCRRMVQRGATEIACGVSICSALEQGLQCTAGISGER